VRKQLNMRPTAQHAPTMHLRARFKKCLLRNILTHPTSKRVVLWQTCLN